MKVKSNLEYQASQINNENDLDEFLAEYLPDGDIAIKRGVITIDGRTEFEFGDWLLYCDSEDGTILVSHKEDFDDDYQKI